MRINCLDVVDDVVLFSVWVIVISLMLGEVSDVSTFKSVLISNIVVEVLSDVCISNIVFLRWRGECVHVYNTQGGGSGGGFFHSLIFCVGSSSKTNKGCVSSM